MTSVFLTGATGLIGGNIAQQLRERGDEVHALVRPGSEAGPLEEMGVRVVRGDVSDAEAVRRAADKSEYAIHSAAVLGGPRQRPDEHESVNVQGTGNVLDTAREVGVARVVSLSTTTFFEARDEPLTEHSPLDPSPSEDPYTLTKRRAFLDAMRRVEEGEDICIVISGGAYGPSPLAERSMAIPSFNQRAVAAIQGELTSYVSFPVPWVFAADVAAASIAAMERGVAGERYLAFGRQEDVGSIPFFCNVACEVAGSPNRVVPVPPEDLDRPEVAARLGPSIVALGRKRFPEPLFRNDLTVERLAYTPMPLVDGLGITVPWLRLHNLLRES
jgi:dihydroflavonol-4-reductase